MTEPRPRLVAVEGGPGEPSAEAPAAPAPRRGAGRRAGWLLAALLLLALVALAVQTRRVGELTGQVRGLTADLGEARSALSAYQGQLDAVRDSVADLQSRFAELDALVNRDPLDSPGDSTAAPE